MRRKQVSSRVVPWERYACLLLAGLPGATHGGQLVNPVARCADSGVLKHRGEYYVSGTGLPRQMLVSADLVHWRGPHRVFDGEIHWDTSRRMARATQDVHAPCIRYVNGRFHLYWNGIGHAVAHAPLGPYVQPVPDRRFDGEIDPFLFADEDGRLYFYTVKFDRANVIWGQSMASPDQLSGEAVELLRATPDTWESQYGRIVEGPEVIRYRGRCYLLYAANHTSVEYGHYAIGCAVSESPLGFDEASKYPYPVLERNEFATDLECDVLLQTGARGGPDWRYTAESPPPGWMGPDFDVPESWGTGRGGFGWPVRPQSQVHNVNTPWQTPDLWLRHTLELDRAPSPFLQMRIRHLLGAEVYFNGVLAHRSSRRVGPRLLDLSPEAVRALKQGANVIAAHVHGSHRGQRFFDLGLVDPGDHHTDDVVWNTGQPNLVRGPNGFEWYLIYFAMWNEGPHCQGINRVHFFGHELHVDGPTGGRPSQYQPEPYRATFADRFDTHRMDHLGERRGRSWEYAGGLWHVEEEEARVSRGWDFSVPPTGTARAFPRVEPASHYLFEVDVRSAGGNRKPYGAVAWHRDERNWLRITLNPADQAWQWRRCWNGEIDSRPRPLPEDFDFAVYHKLRVENNGGIVEFWIDHVRATADHPLETRSALPGHVGLLSEGALAAYDAVLYTVGWDEYGERISGWQETSEGADSDADAHSPAPRIAPDGLTLDASSGRRSVLKGDPSEAYEFMVQVSAAGELVASRRPRMGVYAAYVDPGNHLRAEIDPVAHTLIATGVLGGRPVGPWQVELGGRRRLFTSARPPTGPAGARPAASHCFEHDSVEAVCDGRVSRSSQEHLPKHTFWPHRGTREWIQYEFDGAQAVDGAEVIWYDDRRSNGGCRVPESWRLLYREGEHWRPVELTGGTTYGTSIDTLHVVRFHEVTTSAVRMVVEQQKNFGSGIYEWTLLRDGIPDQAELLDLSLKRRSLASGIILQFGDQFPYAPPARITVFREDDGAVAPVAEVSPDPTKPNPNRTALRFEPVETDRLRIRIQRTPGRYVRLIRAHAEVVGRRSYNLRTIKLRDRVVLMVDGRQKLTIPGRWPAARVGLTVRSMQARFDGITCFRVNAE